MFILQKKPIKQGILINTKTIVPWSLMLRSIDLWQVYKGTISIFEFAKIKITLKCWKNLIVNYFDSPFLKKWFCYFIHHMCFISVLHILITIIFSIFSSINTNLIEHSENNLINCSFCDSHFLYTWWFAN